MPNYNDGIGYGRPATGTPVSIPEDNRNRFGVIELRFDFDAVVAARAARDGVTPLAVNDTIDLYNLPGPCMLLGTACYVEQRTSASAFRFDVGTNGDPDAYVDGARADRAGDLGSVPAQGGAAAQSIIGPAAQTVRLTINGALPTGLILRVATALVLFQDPFVRRETYG